MTLFSGLLAPLREGEEGQGSGGVEGVRDRAVIVVKWPVKRVW